MNRFEHNTLQDDTLSFSIHLEDEIFRQVEAAVRQSGKTLDALIEQALREWLEDRKPRAWPAKVMVFKGIKTATRLESTRLELSEACEPF